MQEWNFVEEQVQSRRAPPADRNEISPEESQTRIDPNRTTVKDFGTKTSRSLFAGVLICVRYRPRVEPVPPSLRTWPRGIWPCRGWLP